ncbi:hypothetical protein [Nonomuraea sp. SYSU D8015]|uniref:hypothetical protein n=1 Tax=Nonomuraea sp. SYSU D8015 TaxID=2593644 RepID=UPI0016602993|nr:hypothetical protein [Nonomuraea sp. SYSU D8015]
MSSASPDRQFFEALAFVWDITAALELVEGRQPNRRINVDDVADLLRLVSIDENYAATVDLTKPILLAPLPDPRTGKPDREMPIDGWHRIARALHERVTTLPAIALTPEEERKVRIRGGSISPGTTIEEPTPVQDEPYEYTVAGSPVAVFRADDSPVIHIDPLPGGRTLDGSLADMSLDGAEKLKLSLQAALDQEKD